MAMLAALALRINIPVALVTTFVSNPLTMYPMYYFAYELGRKILGRPSIAFDFELSLSWVTDKFLTIWQPLTLGCLILATVSGLVGYVVLDLLWRASLQDYKQRKQDDRRRMERGDDER